jgi:multidrug resistance efflux pump
MRKLTSGILGILTVLFLWYVVADRLTPFTQNARMRAFVVPIVPEVSGTVSEITVRTNDIVEPGAVLVKINPLKYEIAINSAQAALDLAGQNVGADTAEVDAAQARLAQGLGHLTNYEAQANRIFKLEEKGLAPKAKADNARGELAKARADVDRRRAELEKAKSQLGVQGADNARVRAALANLGKARLDMKKTTLKAPSAGIVTDLNIDQGSYASAGKPLMTFISIDDVWLEAYLTENNLGGVKAGNDVEIVFDVAPGKIVKGKVISITNGAGDGRHANAGSLASVPSHTKWLRDPQRFPVIIAVEGYDTGKVEYLGLRVNSQADVVVYTGDHFFWNALAGLWIRFMSIMSYAY